MSGSLMHYLRIGFIIVFLQNFHLAVFSQHVFPLLPSLPAQQPPLSVKQCSCLDNTPSQPLKLLFDNHMSGFVSEILTNNPNRWLGRKIKLVISVVRAKGTSVSKKYTLFASIVCDIYYYHKLSFKLNKLTQ